MDPIRPRRAARGAGVAPALLALVAALAARPTSADPAATGGRAPLDADLAVLVDRAGSLSAADVAAPPWADRFVPTGGPASFGFGAPALWVRFRLWSDTDRARTYVLTWDCEVVVRDATRSLLTRLGYRVLVASGGFEALAQAAAHGGPIHLVVTDVVMPGMNGGELAARLRTSRPEAKVLFISGYDDQVLGRYRLEGEGLDLLVKPFTVEALAAPVRAALSRNPKA